MSRLGLTANSSLAQVAAGEERDLLLGNWRRQLVGAAQARVCHLLHVSKQNPTGPPVYVSALGAASARRLRSNRHKNKTTLDLYTPYPSTS